MDKYKVIQEYNRYYLAEHEKFGYKECFDKSEFEVDENNYIRRKKHSYNSRKLDIEEVKHTWHWLKSKKEGVRQ